MVSAANPASRIDKHERSMCQECADHDGTGGIGAAFVRMRLALQQRLSELKEAYEQGLALDMAMAAEGLETAAIALAANVRDLLTYRASLETWSHAVPYECQALHDAIANLFEVCLCPSPLDVGSCEPQDFSPATSYLWLRECLAQHATQIERILSTCDQ
jgi:hypothetical protein